MEQQDALRERLSVGRQRPGRVGGALVATTSSRTNLYHTHRLCQDLVPVEKNKPRFAVYSSLDAFLSAFMISSMFPSINEGKLFQLSLILWSVTLS